MWPLDPMEARHFDSSQCHTVSAAAATSSHQAAFITDYQWVAVLGDCYELAKLIWRSDDWPFMRMRWLPLLEALPTVHFGSKNSKQIGEGASSVAVFEINYRLDEGLEFRWQPGDCPRRYTWRLHLQ